MLFSMASMKVAALSRMDIKWSSLASLKLSLMVLVKTVTSSRMHSKQASLALRAANRAMAGNSSSKDFSGSLKLPKPIYSLICQLGKHVENNLLGKGSLQPVASPGECRLKAKVVGPEILLSFT